MADRLRFVFLCLFVTCAIASQWGLRASAGTTGTLIGYVLTQRGAAVKDASVSAVSASQSAATVTDDQGHFVFVSLIPDTYVVTVSKSGYRIVSQPRR